MTRRYQDIEVPVYKKEPYLVQHPVEREVQVPKTMVQQIEVSSAYVNNESNEHR